MKRNGWNPLWGVPIFFGILIITAVIIDIIHRRAGYVGFPQMSFVIGGSILLSIIIGALFVCASVYRARTENFRKENHDHT